MSSEEKYSSEGESMEEESEEDDGGNYFASDSDEEEENKEVTLDLKRVDSKKMSKNYRYEIMDKDKLTNLFLSKLLAFKSAFEYANIHDSLYIQIFKANQFISSKTNKALNDKIFDYMEKYAVKKIKLGDLGEDENWCNICCIEIEEQNQLRHFGCGHLFCSDCMAGYVEYKLKEGPDSLNTKCPFDGCLFQITPDLVEEILTPKDKKTFMKFVLDMFVTQSPYLVYCPSPECNFALMAGEDNLSYKGHLAQLCATCHCGTIICMRCKGLAHEPLSCEMYTEWEDSIEIVYDKLNYKWKKDNTKKCPGCKADIEKNQGCNFMKCKACAQQFCWFCLEDWKKHDQKHVWKNTCNKFVAEKSLEEMNEEEKLKRMEFFMDRYRGHKLSYELNNDRIKAHLLKMEDDELDFKQLNTNVVPGCLNFYIDAMKFIALPRTFLAYTYALAYEIKNEKENDLFVMTQSLLEFSVERFDKFIDENPMKFLIAKNSIGITQSLKYGQILQEIQHLSLAMKTQFENAKKEFTSETFLARIKNVGGEETEMMEGGQKKTSVLTSVMNMFRGKEKKK